MSEKAFVSTYPYYDNGFKEIGKFTRTRGGLQPTIKVPIHKLCKTVL